MLLLPTDATEEKTTHVQTDAILHAIEDHKLFKKLWIHASKHSIINPDGEGETGKSQMGKGYWVTDICYS